MTVAVNSAHCRLQQQFSTSNVSAKEGGSSGRSSFSVLRDRMFGRRAPPNPEPVKGNSEERLGKRVLWLGHSHDSQYVLCDFTASTPNVLVRQPQSFSQQPTSTCKPSFHSHDDPDDVLAVLPAIASTTARSKRHGASEHTGESAAPAKPPRTRAHSGDKLDGESSIESEGLRSLHSVVHVRANTCSNGLCLPLAVLFCHRTHHHVHTDGGRRHAQARCIHQRFQQELRTRNILRHTPCTGFWQRRQHQPATQPIGRQRKLPETRPVAGLHAHPSRLPDRHHLCRRQAALQPARTGQVCSQQGVALCQNGRVAQRRCVCCVHGVLVMVGASAH